MQYIFYKINCYDTNLHYLTDTMSVQQEQLKLKLRHPIRTTYYKNFFLLRTVVLVNGQHAQVGCERERMADAQLPKSECRSDI